MVVASITDDHRRALRALGLDHMIVIDKDVSLRVVGAIESVFNRLTDAETELSRLNNMYSFAAENAFRLEAV